MGENKALFVKTLINTVHVIQNGTYNVASENKSQDGHILVSNKASLHEMT